MLGVDLRKLLFLTSSMDIVERPEGGRFVIHAQPGVLAGGAAQAIAFPINLRQWGNALAIWLGIKPSDLFLYIFLPPMLLDAAIRISYFHFRKVLSPPPLPSWCLPSGASASSLTNWLSCGSCMKV